MKVMKTCLLIGTLIFSTISLQAESNTELLPQSIQEQSRFETLQSPDLMNNEEQQNLIRKAQVSEFQALERDFNQRFKKSKKHKKKRHENYNANLDNNEPCLKRDGITRENVGDPESFGCPMRWAGLGQTNSIRITNAECIPDEFTRCLPASDDGSFGSFDELDVATLVLPPNTAKSLMCHSLTPLNFMQYANNSGTPADSVFFFTPYVTLENAALDDPALINNRTGLPFNGSVDSGFAASTFRQRTMDAGENELDFQSYTRQCIAGFMSYNLLSSSFELSDEVIEDFFANETTIRIHIRGSHNLVSDGSIRMGYRIYTD